MSIHNFAVVCVPNVHKKIVRSANRIANGSLRNSGPLLGHVVLLTKDMEKTSMIRSFSSISMVLQIIYERDCPIIDRMLDCVSWAQVSH